MFLTGCPHLKFGTEAWLLALHFGTRDFAYGITFWYKEPGLSHFGTRAWLMESLTH